MTRAPIVLEYEHPDDSGGFSGGYFQRALTISLHCFRICAMILCVEPHLSLKILLLHSKPLLFHLKLMELGGLNLQSDRKEQK